MAVKRRNGRWIVEFMQAGHRVFKRLPEEASRKDALDYEGKLRREIFDQRTLGKRPNVSLEYAIKTWLASISGSKSEGATASHAAQVLRVAGSKPVSGCVQVAAELSSPIIAAALSPATTNRRLCVLKAVAKFAWRKGWTEENLSARIQLLPENNARHIYLSPDQVEALLAATPDNARAFVAIAAYTGLRQSEVMALTKEDITETTIRVTDSKTGSPRQVPAVAGLLPYLSMVPLKGHKRTLYKGFEAARTAIGMPHLHYHDLRHTTASLMIQAGVPLYTVGEILGHKSTQTTKRYAHLAMENKREALDKAFPSHQDYSGQPPENEDK